MKIPSPEFLIFYNGEEERPEREVLTLSDLYTTTDKGVNLELKALFISEVKKVSIFEYDQEEHIKMEREEAWQDGRNAGLAEGRTAGLAHSILKMHKKGWSVSQIAELLEEEEIVIEEIIEKQNTV